MKGLLIPGMVMRSGTFIYRVDKVARKYVYGTWLSGQDAGTKSEGRTIEYWATLGWEFDEQSKVRHILRKYEQR